MKFFGEQMNCALDSFKPYQRPRLSDAAHEKRGLQPQRDGRWSIEKRTTCRVEQVRLSVKEPAAVR
jgi:hypothetical protein